MSSSYSCPFITQLLPDRSHHPHLLFSSSLPSFCFCSSFLLGIDYLAEAAFFLSLLISHYTQNYPKHSAYSITSMSSLFLPSPSHISLRYTSETTYKFLDKVIAKASSHYQTSIPLNWSLY